MEIIGDGRGREITVDADKGIVTAEIEVVWVLSDDEETPFVIKFFYYRNDPYKIHLKVEYEVDVWDYSFSRRSFENSGRIVEVDRTVSPPRRQYDDPVVEGGVRYWRGTTQGFDKLCLAVMTDSSELLFEIRWDGVQEFEQAINDMVPAGREAEFAPVAPVIGIFSRRHTP